MSVCLPSVNIWCFMVSGVGGMCQVWPVVECSSGGGSGAIYGVVE